VLITIQKLKNEFSQACNYQFDYKFEREADNYQQEAFRGYYLSRSLMMTKLEGIKLANARLDYQKKYIKKLKKPREFYINEINKAEK
jgi:hypothetical protein